jgi:hypothetical protein
MWSIARVRWRKKAKHLTQVEQGRWRETEQEREADKHRQGQSEQAFKQSEEGDWWRVLEVSPDAGMDEIRGAYRHKMRQYHPDRVSALAPEFLELAERRTKALNAAYLQATQAMPAPQGVHPFQRLWSTIMIAVMFLCSKAFGSSSWYIYRLNSSGCISKVGHRRSLRLNNELSDAIATSRADHLPPRSGPEVQHRRWGRGRIWRQTDR